MKKQESAENTIRFVPEFRTPSGKLLSLVAPPNMKDLPRLFVDGIMKMKDDPVYGILAQEAFKGIKETKLLKELEKLVEEKQNQNNMLWIHEAAEYLKMSVPTLRRRVS